MKSSENYNLQRTSKLEELLSELKILLSSERSSFDKSDNIAIKSYFKSKKDHEDDAAGVKSMNACEPWRPELSRSILFNHDHNGLASSSHRYHHRYHQNH